MKWEETAEMDIPYPYHGRDDVLPANWTAVGKWKKDSGIETHNCRVDRRKSLGLEPQLGPTDISPRFGKKASRYRH